MPYLNNKQLKRFMDKVSIDNNGCWNWTAYKDRKGYGRFKSEHVGKMAHRVSYMHFIGDIEDGLTIDHLCRNTSCVNPNHLEAVTNRENILRGNGTAGMNSRKTECWRGHEYTVENTYIDPRGRRQCRKCWKIWKSKNKPI